MKSHRFDENRQRAIALYTSGHSQEALLLCQQLCKLADDAAIYCLMGVIHGQLGTFAESAACCSKALALSPNYVYAEAHLGFALRNLCDLQGARKAFENVTRKNPGDFAAHYQLGLIREDAGEFGEAIECYRTAQQLNPGYQNAHAGIASVYEKRGDIERAWQVISELIRPAVTNPQVAIMYGRLAKKLDLEEQPARELEQYLEIGSLQPQDRLQIQFALGELLDSRGEYDRAFMHFSSANKLKGARFNPERFARKVDGLIDRFNRSTLLNAARATHASEQLVFVIGMPRSGTTLVEQILSTHPSVYGAGEVTHMSVIAASLEQQNTDVLNLSEHGLDQIAYSYLEHTSTFTTDAVRVVDKLPDNFLRLGHIELLFPGARIIHCKRNAMDTCLSCYFRNFSIALAACFDLENIADYYLGYRRIMRHWKEVVSLPIIEVEYEKLISDTENQTRRLIEFCGLPWHDRCLEFYNNKRFAKTASYDQVRRPIYTSAVGHWRNYERHLQPLIHRLESVSPY